MPLQGRPASDLSEQLKQLAIKHQFLESGVVDLSQIDPLQLKSHTQRYQEWVHKGFSGEMHYLERGAERRVHPEQVLPGLKSVFTVLVPYIKKESGKVNSSEGVRYARYLNGEDYHKLIKRRLKALMLDLTSLRESLHQDVPRWKVCVDTSAVLERMWAYFCGLGWVGKNTLLIHPKHGSYFFIGVIYLDQETGQKPKMLPSYCGNCERCLNQCPTQALASDRWLDSRKCLSYQTLEYRGDELPVSSPWVAGCDICQEVCPFNTKPVRNESLPLPVEGAVLKSQWTELLIETEQEYRQRIQGSALSRIKFSAFDRNLAASLRYALLESPKSFDKKVFGELIEMRMNQISKSEHWKICLQLLNELS